MEESILKIDFSNVLVILLSIVVFALIIFVRYLIVSRVYHWVFFKRFGKVFPNRILNKKPLKKKQIIKEIYWSLISGFIFGGIAVFIYYLWSINYTAIYIDPKKYSLWYIPLSILAFLCIQDTYYYWIHRWMHIPKFYKFFHKTHHKSVHTTVFTSFSFHPYETLLQAIYLPFVLVFLPLHIYALLAVLLIMTLSATINHAGIEVYPSGKFGNKFKKWIIGATHHDAHHTKFNYNYGLYFTFWDRLMRTELEEKQP
ncbi:sterol desaturase family protein [uncultured Polaribacter sp.]|uniref:sterol desaturase family protein n=1 Tax=uncultured Polaribacter sp. TaxID=174711 RepID=UPI002613C47A|nr:sterol desaturase family protein [uncultured Polaribacter sp.]